MGEQIKTNELPQPGDAASRSRSALNNQAMDLLYRGGSSPNPTSKTEPTSAETWQERDKRMGEKGFKRLDALGHEFYWRDNNGQLIRDKQGKAVPAYFKYEMQRDQRGQAVPHVVWAPMEDSGLKTPSVRSPEPIADGPKPPEPTPSAPSKDTGNGTRTGVETWQERDERLGKEGYRRVDAAGKEFYWRDEKGQLKRDNHGKPIPAYHKFETVKDDRGQETQRVVWAPEWQSGLRSKLGSPELDALAQSLATKSDQLAKENGLNNPEFRKALTNLVEKGGIEAATAFAEKTGEGYFVSAREAKPGQVTMQFFKVVDGNREVIAADLNIEKKPSEAPQPNPPEAPPAPGRRPPAPQPETVPPPPQPENVPPPPRPEAPASRGEPKAVEPGSDGRRERSLEAGAKDNNTGDPIDRSLPSADLLSRAAAKAGINLDAAKVREAMKAQIAGEIAAGTLQPADLNKPPRVGTAMIATGAITAQELNEALAKQSQLRKEAEAKGGKAPLLGDLLKTMHSSDKAKVEKIDQASKFYDAMKDEMSPTALGKRCDELFDNGKLNDPSFRKDLSTVIGNAQDPMKTAMDFAFKTKDGYYVAPTQTGNGELTIRFSRDAEGKVPLAEELKIQTLEGRQTAELLSRINEAAKKPDGLNDEALRESIGAHVRRHLEKPLPDYVQAMGFVGRIGQDASAPVPPIMVPGTAPGVNPDCHATIKPNADGSETITFAKTENGHEKEIAKPLKIEPFPDQSEKAKSIAAKFVDGAWDSEEKMDAAMKALGAALQEEINQGAKDQMSRRRCDALIAKVNAQNPLGYVTLPVDFERTNNVDYRPRYVRKLDLKFPD